MIQTYVKDTLLYYVYQREHVITCDRQIELDIFKWSTYRVKYTEGLTEHVILLIILIWFFDSCPCYLPSTDRL